MYGCCCCSEQCERKLDCALYGSNISGRAILCMENFYDYGIGSVTTGKSDALWFCGPHGEWGMFIPMDRGDEY